MTPAQLRNAIVKALIYQFNLKVDGTEITRGARKIWLKTSDPEIRLDKVIARLKRNFPNRNVRWYHVGWHIIGDGFEMEKQGRKGLFLACYNTGKAGIAYEAGVDC